MENKDNKLPKDFTVYMHIFPNGKRYVGMTGRKLKERFKNGQGYKDNKEMYKDILFYGWKNIKHIVFEEKLDMFEAIELEKELIIKHKANNPNFGYNKVVDGQYFYRAKGHDGCKMNQKTRKEVVCLETKQVFSSIRECARYFDIDKAHISNCCKGKEISSKGLHFKFKNDENYKVKKRKLGKIKVKCLENGMIFTSCAEADCFFGFTKGSISHYLNHKECKSVKGLHFEIIERW